MLNLDDINRKLRRTNQKNYFLYWICNFVSLLVITAYSAMMYSKTVQNILPEGGDSRKQVYAIFVLACIGCIVFTIYAANLFYRMKAKEIGTMMALGASKKCLQASLMKEVALLTGTAGLAGAAGGIPFAWLIWQCFRLFVVDSEEMTLYFNFSCLLVPAIFLILVVLSTFILGMRFLNRTNIMEVVHEEHKNEPIREVSRICGPLGAILLLAGAVTGYCAPSLYMQLFSSYSPAWLNLLYIPVFIGLYMILLHTVVHGFGRRKSNPYRGIISRSMMKFQGKQTVNNMLVVTVLVAGACFGMFYAPILATGQMMDTSSRPYDYFYHYRLDQNLPDRKQVEDMAESNGISIQDWTESSYATLGMDGQEEVPEENGKFHYEYKELMMQGQFLSASVFSSITGQKVEIPQGSYYAITNNEETNMYMINTECTLLTNMSTRKNYTTKFGGTLPYSLLTGQPAYYVLQDDDYEMVTKGITDEWMEKLVLFNHCGEEDSYAFATQLFHKLVNSFGPECEIKSYYDRVSKAGAELSGKTYWGDTSDSTKISYQHMDSFEFRQYWYYMPKFRILDQTDFLRSTAVFVMMFIFIAIVCTMASLIICYTRCMTIALNNRYVFDDLKRLGASCAYLKKEVKSQSSKVFLIPSAIGMGIMYLLYCMILLGNDNRISKQEIIGLSLCLLLIAAFGLMIWLVYRYTLRQMIRTLHIQDTTIPS